MGRNGVEIGIKAKNIHNYKTKSELTNAEHKAFSLHSCRFLEQKLHKVK
jgi:hypothetical protein